ncbi:OFA family oxalate/formate antiporter-like MFS transporter [Fontibacillus solani]|uniref:OFA family oxalate/formate antiporter-like MFS transporter n=1 Tax=Fontibacillus solani TaxID=1572857 RepID=A0A7W3XU72_9BACL|nr:OFA family MFS transporter [Fontibacillus solani]MBA9088368.1 OFA family oxalate/formate antiporter-like MFS transporter [Fontibacillus solani]
MKNGLASKQSNRVIVFTAAFIIIFCCSASAAFSVFAKPLQEATGGTASQVALTLTIYQFTMSLFGIISGKIVDKSGPKKLMYIGGFVFGMGWLLTAFAPNLFMLYITCGFIAGAGNGLLYNPSINTALRWFPEMKGTMSGILLGAASLGPLVLAKVGAILCDRFGTQGFVFIGLAYLILVWMVGWRMILPEKGWKPEGWNPLAVKQPGMEREDYTPSEMIKTSTFWIMLVLFSIACTAGIMMIGSLSTIAQVQLGMTAVTAANMVVINCLANFCGRLIVGKLCDKWGENNTLVLVLVVTIVGLLGLRVATTSMVFIAFLILLGAAFGGVLVVYPPLTSKTFGVKNFGVNYGIMFFGYSIGALLGPQIAARAVNQDLGTSAYSHAYLIAVAVALVGLALNFYLIRKKRLAVNS